MSWPRTLASVTAAMALVVLIPSACSTLPTAACGDEADTDVCGRLQYSCGTAVVCYSCGIAKRVNCGACAASQTCGGGGVPHVCWPPLVDGGDGGGGEAGTAGGDASADGAASDAAIGDAAAADGASSDGAAKDAAPPGDGATDAALDATLDGSTDASVAPVADDGGDGGPTMVLCPEDAVPPEDTGASE